MYFFPDQHGRIPVHILTSEGKRLHFHHWPCSTHVIHHPESNLKIKIFNASESDQNKSLFYKNFNVTANDLKEKKKFITPIAATKTLGYQSSLKNLL